MSTLGEFSPIISLSVAVIAIISKLWADYKKSKKTDSEVSEAEKQAFKSIPESLVNTTQELLKSQETLEHRSKEIKRLIDESQNALQRGSLFNLYNKQIEKYQLETQRRASWSFIFAIVAMAAGLGFVFWGGTYIITGNGWEHVAAGAAISAIGGSISAFIAKTFLDVHKLSLSQLNRYFRQPVLNAYILTAQRLADEIGNAELREKSYELIIKNITSLIRENEVEKNPLSSGITENKIERKSKKRKITPKEEAEGSAEAQ